MYIVRIKEVYFLYSIFPYISINKYIRIIFKLFIYYYQNKHAIACKSQTNRVSLHSQYRKY